MVVAGCSTCGAGAGAGAGAGTEAYGFFGIDGLGSAGLVVVAGCSKADAGASKTYPQQAGTIRKNGYIVIKGRPCKVVEVSTSKTGKHGHAKCHFVGIDVFTGKKLEDIVPSSHNCDVPHVDRTEYQLIDITEDGFVSLLTDSGNTKDDLRLPTDEALEGQIKSGYDDGKDLLLTVMSSMGEEQICAVKEIGGKN